MSDKIDPLFANHPELLARQRQTKEFMDGLRRDMRRPTFDIKCYQLAAHFISDVDALNDTVDAEQNRNELAAHIQSSIADWIAQELKDLR